MRDWLARSKENAKEYGRSRYKKQPFLLGLRWSTPGWDPPCPQGWGWHCWEGTAVTHWRCCASAPEFTGNPPSGTCQKSAIQLLGRTPVHGKVSQWRHSATEPPKGVLGKQLATECCWLLCATKAKCWEATCGVECGTEAAAHTAGAGH